MRPTHRFSGEIFKSSVFWMLIFSFLLKTFFLFFFSPPFRLWEDHTIALNILSTGNFYIDIDGAVNHSFQFPVYPTILSVLYLVFGCHPIVACLYNNFINLLTGFVLAGLLKEFLACLNLSFLSEKKRKSVIRLTVFAYILHPAINFYTLCNVHPFIQNMFFLLLATSMGLRLAKRVSSPQTPDRKHTLVFGLVLGLAILDRGTALFSILPFTLVLFFRKGLTKTISQLALILPLAVAVCLPWILHNYATDKITGLESAAGKDMLKGLLKNSEGSNYLSDGSFYSEAFSKAEMDHIGRLTAGQQNTYYMQRVRDIWKTHPGFAIKMYLIKLKNFWWFRTRAGNEQSQRIQKLVPLYKSFYLIVLLLVLASFYYLRGKVLILLSVPMALSLLQAAFYVETRHRIIIEPLLIFIALLALTCIFSRTRMPFLPEKNSNFTD